MNIHLIIICTNNYYKLGVRLANNFTKYYNNTNNIIIHLFIMLSFFSRYIHKPHTYKMEPYITNQNTYTYDTDLKKYIRKIELDLLEKQKLKKIGFENIYSNTNIIHNYWTSLVGLSFFIFIACNKLVNSKLLNN